MTVQLCEPALPVVGKPHAVLHDIGQPSQAGGTHGKIEVPDRAAVKKRVIRFFEDKKAEALHVPLGHEILHHVHFGPGCHVHIVFPGFSGLRIDTVFLIEGLFRLPHIIRYILFFLQRGSFRILDDKMMPVGGKPVFLFFVPAVHLQQISPADIVGDRLL